MASTNERSNVVDQCIKKLKAAGNTQLLIPDEIMVLRERYPPVVCNYINEEIAKAILTDSRYFANSAACSAGVVNEDLHNYFMELPRGTTMMIHHRIDKNYMTTVAEFQYDFNGTLIFGDNSTIGCCNIIAAVRIPALSQMLKRSLRDNNHIIFNIMTKRSYPCN